MLRASLAKSPPGLIAPPEASASRCMPVHGCPGPARIVKLCRHSP
jgi:hypothetical protein